MPISHRVEVYLSHTSPLIDYYAGRDILVRIDATGSIDEVTASINARLDRLVPPRIPS